MKVSPRALPQNESSLPSGESKESTYTTGEMARLSSNTLRTVRFYEEAGILTPIGRTEGGHRVFKKSELDRLKLVSDMREAGLSLDDIREILAAKRLASSADVAAGKATELLTKCVERLRTKVEILSRLARDLEETVECASHCRNCKAPQLFPDGCGQCETLERPLPRGMRVLWDVKGAPEPTKVAVPEE